MSGQAHDCIGMTYGCTTNDSLGRLDLRYTSLGCTNLQSLVKCLGHRGIASKTVQYAVKQGCVRLRNANDSQGECYSTFILFEAYLNVHV